MVRNEEINLSALIDQIYEKLKYMIDSIEIDVRKNIETDKLKSDPSRISVILSNIISNSIKYADAKKSSNWIEISFKNEGRKYQLSIEDNGLGIEEEYQGRIFDMFYRPNDRSNGSGLGLYIVKETIDKLHGGIKLESRAGECTKFTITIPN